MRADRLMAILLHLQAAGQATVRELAERLEVSERTVQRDMEALAAGGIPLYALRGAKGGWVLPEGYRSRLTGMTAGEIRALLLLQSSSVIKDLALGEDAGQAIAKLLSALPADKRAEAEFVRRRLHVDGAGWHEPQRPATWLSLVQQAVWEGRKLRIRYASLLRQTEETPSEGASKAADNSRLVSPWGLVAKQATWYFVAKAEQGRSEEGAATGREAEDGELRTYRVSRLLEAELTDERFGVPPDFDLAAWWDASTRRFKATLPRYPARVRVRSDARERFAAERYVRVREWRDAADGWAEAEVEFHTLESARDLLLPYGAAVQAVSPAELRQAIRRTAADLLKLYDGE